MQAVDLEPFSESVFPDLQGKYSEFTRNRLRGEAGFSGPSPVSGSYAACFPEFGNREISTDEQGIPRRELRMLLVTAEK